MTTSHTTLSWSVARKLKLICLKWNPNAKIIGSPIICTGLWKSRRSQCTSHKCTMSSKMYTSFTTREVTDDSNSSDNFRWGQQPVPITKVADVNFVFLSSFAPRAIEHHIKHVFWPLDLLYRKISGLIGFDRVIVDHVIKRMSEHFWTIYILSVQFRIIQIDEHHSSQ